MAPFMVEHLFVQGNLPKTFFPTSWISHKYEIPVSYLVQGAWYPAPGIWCLVSGVYLVHVSGTKYHVLSTQYWHLGYLVSGTAVSQHLFGKTGCLLGYSNVGSCSMITVRDQPCVAIRPTTCANCGALLEKDATNSNCKENHCVSSLRYLFRCSLQQQTMAPPITWLRGAQSAVLDTGIIYTHTLDRIIILGG